MWCLFHKWSKWEYYTEYSAIWAGDRNIFGTTIRRRKGCLICGKVKDEKMSDTYYEEKRNV